MEDPYIETNSVYFKLLFQKTKIFREELNEKKISFLKQNKKETSGDKARRMANRELNEMAERLSVDKSIVVS